MRDLELSVLDLSPVPSGTPTSAALHETVELARTVERAGYRRMWLAEHHGIPSVASSSPEILIGAAAGATSTLRVGSGGIMLPNHSPLKVAETFRALAGLYPDRIDLGLGRAPGTDPRTAIALRRSREALTADDFPEQFSELRGYVDGFPADHPFAGIVAVPDDVPLPPVWILASSYYGGQAAAAFGTGFAYAGHFGGADPGEATRIYRQQFRPSDAAGAQDPHVILAAAVMCSEDAERARAMGRAHALSMARLRTGNPGPLPSPEEALAHDWSPVELQVEQAMASKTTAGTPAEVRDDLERRAREADADEIMIVTPIHDAAERRRSYELIAEEFGPAAPGVTGAAPSLAQV
ncbi:LLM class flavin-dependent oxidoreductase [Actinomycetospora lemnae]|uniref:LLM class flavin-dependent oxidoreductase n=1 Tax=Actinomycetospora lemnae TaxID=3019891 RepID=A0ABT5SRZ6_9PSEU|nr:LLM class flavin-dependent oxidoreductase [Actinomycetospora sp. DW7H6]MDD7965603.1 LLM class flavin-dependent oxidoreductase [Actinomycetospora sp. DW7H6]